MPAKVANDLLRIGQEALTNAVRHANARQITLTLDFEPRAVRLAVNDNGCGLTAASSEPGTGGFGLRGMRARANALHADLRIHSAPGAGTTITLTVPNV